MDNKNYTEMLEMIADNDSFGYLLDRLISSCIKLTKFDWIKHEEQAKDNPDEKKISIIMEKARCANEERHSLCNALDAKLKISVEKGEYKFRKDVRTFETLL
jgi:hypothetical protein